MAITTDRIIGNDVTVTCAGSVTKWREIDVEFSEKTSDASSSDSELDEEVSTKRKISGRVTGYLGQVNNGATLPMIGDVVNDLDVETISGQSTTSVLPPLTGYTNIKIVGPVKYNFKDDAATFEFNFRSGRLN